MIRSLAANVSDAYHLVAHRATPVRATGNVPEAEFVARFHSTVVNNDRRRLEALKNSGSSLNLEAAVDAPIAAIGDLVAAGDRPLHVAAGRSNLTGRAVTMTTLLLQCGADPNVRNDAGETPAMRAYANQQYGQLAVIAQSPRYNGDARMPTGRDGSSGPVVRDQESLLEHAYRTNNYRVQHILETARPLASLLPPAHAQRMAALSQQLRAEMENLPPAYTACAEPPSYARFMQGVPPPAYREEASEPAAAVAGTPRQRRVSAP